jgi:hypothetical protein
MQLIAEILRRKQAIRGTKSFAAEKIIGSYYICSNDGLYWVENGWGRQISTQGGYGMAIDGCFAVRSVDIKGASRIVSLKLGEGPNSNYSEGEIIYEIPFKSSNGRIHQVTSDGKGNFYAAMAERNSILKFSKIGNEWRFAEFTPFSDRFGVPIVFDHNHINSVLPHRDFLLFVAYKAGTGSMIGTIRANYVLGFHYPNQGMHDIFLTKSGFLCFDTFGNSKSNGGLPITENGPMRAPVFDQSPGYILRGAAQFEGETLYGHSHKGERSKRFEGNGGLLHFYNGQFTYYPVPSAQVYQIIRKDGFFFDHGEVAFESLICQLTRVFGEPTYEAVVADV